jgi:hypothetical protein
MNPLAFELLGSLDAFPRGRHFDQDTFFGNALGLVHGNQALTAGYGGLGVKAQAGIDFGGHTPRDDGHNLAAKTHQKMVHGFIQRLAAVLCNGGAQEGRVLGLLNRFQNQRGIGGGVLGLEGVKLFEVSGVSDHGRTLFERVELVHKKNEEIQVLNAKDLNYQ